MIDARITRIEWARLEGRRPRSAGSNARLGDHGIHVRPGVARVTMEDGASGFGSAWLSREQAESLAGARLSALFDAATGVLPAGRSLEYPLWDLVGRRTGKPVHALAAGVRRAQDANTAGAAPTDSEPACAFRAPCYDTSLYFDDLHLDSDAEAADLIAAEALEGRERGHRAFKIKVGRGARHLPLEAGALRDVAIVRAVREAVGPDAGLLLDANNGYNLNLAKRVLDETAACGIVWLEEPFHEDPVLFRDLKEWLAKRSLPVLIADGEGQASPTLLDWAREGLVDVVQYDIFGHGFTRWLETGLLLDGWGARSAPHHYGGHLGNYAACHLAGAIRGFAYVEWDEATTPGIDASAYSLRDGWVDVPNLPGFGLELQEAVFQTAVEATGYSLPA